MTPVAFQRGQIALYALLTSLTAISIDALLPGLRLIEAELPTSPPLSTQHVVALFILGMAFGELLLGPLSDAIGRRGALFLGLIIYAIGALIALSAGSMEQLVLGRILQGVGVAGPKIATRAMIRDQFEGDAMARVLSVMFAIFILVPMIAPALGQGVIALGGWRAVFVVYLAMAAILALWLAARQPETLPADRRIPFRPRYLVRNGGRILARRRVSLLIVATGFVFGAQLLYLSTAADLFFDVYGIEKSFPVYFAALAAAIGLAAYLNAKLVQRVGMDTMARVAFVQMAAIGALMLGASAIWAGRPPLAVFMVLGFAGFFAIGVLFGNLNAMAMRPLAQVAGLGAALIASGSSLVAALFAVAFGVFYDGTITYLAAAFFAAGVVALLLSKWAAQEDSAPVEAVR